MDKKTYTTIAVIVILLIAGWLLWNGAKKAQAPQTQEQPAVTDTTGAIQKDVANIDIGNVETGFAEVDQSIKGL